MLPFRAANVRKKHDLSQARRGIIHAHEASSPVDVQLRGGWVGAAVRGDVRSVGSELSCPRLIRVAAAAEVSSVLGGGSDVSFATGCAAHDDDSCDVAGDVRGTR